MSRVSTAASMGRTASPWFSSAMFPFTTQGWPNEDRMGELGFDIALPTSVLVTGFDIIFF